MRRVLSCLVIMLICAMPIYAVPRIGILPIPESQSDESALSSDELRSSIQQTIAQNITQTKSCDVVVLPWPEFMDETDTPNFETLVQQARNSNCNGVVFVRIDSIRADTKDVDVPLLGSTVKADAEVTLCGGLIDVATAVGVAPLRATAKKSQQPMKGPEPGDLQGKGLDDKEMKNSVLGQALIAACQQIGQDVQKSLIKITSQSAVKAARTNAPSGLRFELDTTPFSTFTGYDRRGTITVLNNSDTAKAFKLLPISKIKDVTAGFVGEGSIDKACILKPGQSKFVRFILNTDRLLKDEQLKVGLFTAEEPEQIDIKSKPHDTAVIQLTTKTPDARLKLEVLRQDPATLAYSCRLSNAGAAVWGIGVTAENIEFSHLIRFEPNVSQNVFVPANGSVEFSVIPNLCPGMPAFDVPISVSGMSDQNPATVNLHFAVPAGQSVYYGLAHTSSSGGSFQGYCINEGGDYSQDPNGNQYCTGLGHDWSNGSFSANMGYLLGSIWAALSNVGYVPPDWNAVNGVRGGTIRKSLLSRLPELAVKNSLYPGLVNCNDGMGIFLHTPAPDGTPTVIFGINATQTDKMMNVSQLNDKGHSAMWPHACYLDPNMAAVTWVDAVPNAKSNAAVRISKTDDYLTWQPITYLTTHGKGVDDPFIISDKQGNLIVAWEDLRSGSSRIYMRVSKDGGKQFGPEVALSASAGESQRWPQLVVLSNGIGLCYTSSTSGRTSINYRRIDLSGKDIGKPQVLSVGKAECGEPSICVSGDNQVYAVWREGDGAESEIWFSKVSDTPNQPLRLTQDSAYSEYPAISYSQKTIHVVYHSDISGVTDLQYRISSTDGGKSWSQPVMQPSLQGAVKKAWLETTFNLENSREDYPPFDMRFKVNNTEVGLMKKSVLEGCYLFPVPAEAIRGYMGKLMNNNVETKVENAMDGHFIYASHHRLIANWAYTQIAVAAASQKEADQIALSTGVDRNHTSPDLALIANKMPKLPAKLTPGLKIPLVFQVVNVGEATANEVVLDIYGGDKVDLSAGQKPLKSLELKPIAPGESADASYTFEFNPKTTPRIHAALRMKEKDFYPSDNTWSVSFSLGAAGTVSPTVGTDTPNLFYTPDILKSVNISDPTKILNMISLPNISQMLRIPELPQLPTLDLPNLQDIASPITEKLQQLDIPVPNVGDLLGVSL